MACRIPFAVPTTDPMPPATVAPRLLARAVERFSSLVHTFVPPACLGDADRARRARLLVHFGLQGTAFGLVYALFYWAIGHGYGALVIVVCTAFFAAVPWLLRRTGALGLAGHLLVGTMTIGFTLLTLIEGGIHSHAIAWLAAVPLCALLVLGARPAGIWAGICVLVCVAVGTAALLGFDLDLRYDVHLRRQVDAAGNLGIIVFLFALGLVFEVSRATAFRKMRSSIDELAASNEKLAHLNNEKTEFLGIAAHDLRNPLTSVIGFATLLADHSSPQVSSGAGIIRQAGNQMLQLITDLLDANAIEEARYGSEIRPHDLRGLVVTSVEHNRHAADRKGTAIDFPAGPALWADADGNAAVQVLDNLISNALKYSPAGTRVSVRLRAAGDWTEICVRDQGPGISDDDQRLLFRKHTKLTARPTGGESSVGLGLSIVKRLAEAMGGSVRCESRLGEGATFILRLRTAPASLSPPAAPPG